MKVFCEQYDEYLVWFENALKQYCDGMNYRPSVLSESMRYSLLSGGKRVRPVLFLAALDLLGVDWKGETDYAIAIECIHTYSLIHDDLPAMDNDDFRRGKPSSHKQFGEANAILAGDALLNEAFLILLSGAKDSGHLKAAEQLARAAGAAGMIGGQSFDLLSEKRSECGAEDLIELYRKKTGGLIVAPLVMATNIAGCDQDRLREFGENLGILFQLTDDLLDVNGDDRSVGKTLGKDTVENKLTCIKVYGLEQSLCLAEQYAAQCLKSLDGVDGDTGFLQNFVNYVRNRKK